VFCNKLTKKQVTSYNMNWTLYLNVYYLQYSYELLLSGFNPTAAGAGVTVSNVTTFKCYVAPPLS